MMRITAFILLLLSAAAAFAQVDLGKSFVLSGSLQADVLFPEKDEAIGTADYRETALTNTYLDVNLHSSYLSAGTRLEFLKYPLPGFENDFAGWGLPHFYVTGKYKTAELTLGDFYEQLGSGLIFRTYEERSLGIDNSLRGGRLKIAPANGLRIAALGGRQRHYWTHNKSLLWAADAELDIDEWLKQLQEKNTRLLLGFSYVGKHEEASEIYFYSVEAGELMQLNFPENISAISARAQLQKGGFSLLAEYAWKAGNPSRDNSYIYKSGHAALFSASYSQKGFSALVQAKRSDNMSFRSNRDVQGISSYISYLPAFTTQHTHALAAFYPYATQADGEWAFQGEVSYHFKKNTALGGQYGTDIRLNASHIRDIDRKYIAGSGYMGRDEYTSAFLKTGKLFFQDINIGMDKKLSPALYLTLQYLNQRYNPAIVGHVEDLLTANIFVAEGKYRLNKKLTLRTELQYLHCSPYTGSVPNFLDRSNQGDWLFGLLELSVAPMLMFSLSDMYNSGGSKAHYYMVSGAWAYKSHRLQLGYGRTRAGYSCSGGLCRLLPASRGFSLSYLFNV
jgi:hypothetical protein